MFVNNGLQTATFDLLSSNLSIQTYKAASHLLTTGLHTIFESRKSQTLANQHRIMIKVDPLGTEVGAQGLLNTCVLGFYQT